MSVMCVYTVHAYFLFRIIVDRIPDNDNLHLFTYNICEYKDINIT